MNHVAEFTGHRNRQEYWCGTRRETLNLWKRRIANLTHTEQSVHVFRFALLRLVRVTNDFTHEQETSAGSRDRRFARVREFAMLHAPIPESSMTYGTHVNHVIGTWASRTIHRLSAETLQRTRLKPTAGLGSQILKSSGVEYGWGGEGEQQNKINYFLIQILIIVE